MIKPDLSRAETLAEAWLALRAAFRAARLETADLDARLLTAGLAEVEPHRLATDGDMPLPAGLRDRLAQAAGERLGGKPVHRILGARAFYGLSLALSEATLEPRPDTETLVDAVLPFVRQMVTRKQSCSIADLGAGTGAIGLALLAECPLARCLGIDMSADAVETARANARGLGLTERYRATTGDWLTGIYARFDLIVSNPPYIPTADLARLSPEVIKHDPALALDGGADGLDAYRLIAGQAARCLESGGCVAVEIGFGQGPDVLGLFSAAGFEATGQRADLGGVLRVLLFRLPDPSAAMRRDF